MPGYFGFYTQLRLQFSTGRGALGPRFADR